MDHSNFLRRSHYSKAWWEKDINKAIDAIAAAGYATSPTYANTLKSFVKVYNLTQYDVEMEVPTVEPLAINKGIVQGNNITNLPGWQ